MYILIVLLPSLFLLYQSLTCFGFLPFYNITLFSEKNIIIMFLHGCICKWGIVFALIGFIWTLYFLLYKKGRTDSFKKYILKYGVVFIVLAIVSIF